MIDELDRRLARWVQSVLKKVDVSFEPPKAGASTRGVTLIPVGLAADPSARGPRRPPLRLLVQYLVTAWAEKPEESHRWVGELVFAAMDHAEFEVEPEPVPVTLWTALGIAPRAGFLLKAPLRRERPQRPAPRVKEPLVMHRSPMRPLQGVILGPGKIPIMGARVELPAMNASTVSDPNGRFVFPAVPTDPPPKTLRVLAKGLAVDVEVPEKGAEPVVIRLESLEV